MDLRSYRHNDILFDIRQAPFNDLDFLIFTYEGRQLRVPLYTHGCNQNRVKIEERELLEYKYAAADFDGKIKLYKTYPSINLLGYRSEEFPFESDRIKGKSFPLLIIKDVDKKRGVYKREKIGDKNSKWIVDYEGESLKVPDWVRYVAAANGGTVYGYKERPKPEEYQVKKSGSTNLPEKTGYTKLGNLKKKLRYPIKVIEKDEITTEEYKRIKLTQYEPPKNLREKKRLSRQQAKDEFDRAMQVRAADIAANYNEAHFSQDVIEGEKRREENARKLAEYAEYAKDKKVSDVVTKESTAETDKIINDRRRVANVFIKILARRRRLESTPLNLVTKIHQDMILIDSLLYAEKNSEAELHDTADFYAETYDLKVE